MEELIKDSNEHVIHKIYTLRKKKVMLDFDLADLYGVETRVLNQSVKRNIKRFPSDFMFRLTKKEWDEMSSQFVMTSFKRPKKAIPYAFTEQGLAMLSGILNSDKAIEVNITIMRAFVFIRQYALTYTELRNKLKLLENECNKKFNSIYEALDYLLKKDEKNEMQHKRKRIGY